MRKATQKDSNHRQIVKTFKQLYIPFCDLSHVGGGIPDGLVWLHGRWEFVEIKNRGTFYGRQGLNPGQLEWLSNYPDARVFIIESVDDVVKMANGDFLNVKHEIG